MNKLALKKMLALLVTTSLTLSSVVFQMTDNVEARTLVGKKTEGVFELYEPKISENTLPGRADISLDWEDYKFTVGSDKVGSNYVTVRRTINYDTNGNVKNYGDWEVRGGKYGSEIKVLNIYPNREDAAGLKKWMETQSAANENVNIVVTTQSQSDFNTNTFRYLKKNSDGSYNYDVIVFGFWDSYYNLQKMTEPAISEVQKFIDAGHGVVFGHDTVQTSNYGSKGFDNLVKDNMDIILTPDNKKNVYVSDKIGIKKQGSLTTYPFDINGMNLSIPRTHTSAQLPGDTITGVPNDDIVFMTLEPNYYPTPGDGPYYYYPTMNSKPGPDPRVTYNGKSYLGSGYLMKQNNVAFIQTGHSSGSSSQAEQMVLANLMYSLAQVSSESKGLDQILDDAIPTTPVDADKNLVFESIDSGVGYEYRVVATPIGYDVSSIDKDAVKKALDDGATKYNNNVVFSNSYLTSEIVSGIKGSVGYENEADKAAFRYYIDKNKIGTRIPPIEIVGKEDTTDDFYTLKYTEPFNYKNHYSDISKITENDYLHVVAFDRANNASNIANFRLKDILPKSNVTINYVYDENGDNVFADDEIIKTETILAEENPDLLVGSKYSSVADKDLEIDENNYIYSMTKPANYIIIDEKAEKNVITHVYDKLVAKDIYLAEVRPSINGGEQTITETSYMEQVIEAGSIVNVMESKPDLSKQYLTYKGWSQGSNSDYNNLLSDEEFEWTDDSDNIYLYYEKEVATVEINIVRSDKKLFDIGKDKYTYTKDGYVGKKVIVTADDIKSKITVRNKEAFSNISELANYNKTFILEKGGNKDTITLIPKTINVKGVGIDYGNVDVKNTSSSAIKLDYETEKAVSIDKNLFSVPYIYDFDIKVNADAPATYEKEGKVWKNFANEVSGETITIDFSLSKEKQVAYYRGVKPSEAYSVEANYLNIKDTSSPIADKWLTPGDINVVMSPGIPDSDTLEYYVDSADRDVLFELEGYEIIHNGVKKTYGLDIDINDIVPYRDDTGKAEIGDYVVNLYYRPIAQIKHTEIVYDVNGSSVSSAILYEAKFDDEVKSIDISHSKDEYDIETTSPAVYENDKISTKVTDYNMEIITKYTPLVYNLKVEIIANASLDGSRTPKTHFVHSFKNIPVKNSVKFTIPNYEKNNYIFKEAVMIDGEDEDFKYSDDKTKIIFDPVVDPTQTGTNYKMDLHYDLKSEIIGRYTIYSKAQTPIIGEVVNEEVIVVGQEISVKIPDADNYELTHAYVDGKLYDVNAGGVYSAVVTKPMHFIDLEYHEKKYNLDVQAMTEGGTIQGSGEYYSGLEVYVLVVPDEGYSLKKLEVDGIEQPTEEAGTVGYYYFLMPTNDVSIKAYFTKDSSGGGNGGGSGGNKVEKPNKVEPVIPPEIEALLPENLTKQDIYKLKRENMPYIQGYKDGMIQPNANITRAEVVQIIYNLYFEGTDVDNSVLNKFSDVNNYQWYSDAVAFATQTGVVRGYEDGTFRPDNFITRAELASIISKFDINPSNYIDTNFTDINETWAKENIEKLVEHGIINGYSDFTFKPNKTATRAEFVKMVNNLIQRPDEYVFEHSFPDLLPTHWAYDEMMNAANGTKFDFDVDLVLSYLESKQN